MAINKGFIIDSQKNKMLPITRGELVLDASGNIAFFSDSFAAVAPDEQNGIKGHAGLMTAAEKAMLNGSDGQGIADLYTQVTELKNRLNYVRTGLQFNGRTLKFYETSGNNPATPINITSSGDASINITLDTNENGNLNSNTVSLSLKSITTNGLSVTNTFLKNINVDKYGRVTSVSGGGLTNDDIPNLSGKTISNSTLSGCTTDNITESSSDSAIANKLYVDTKINSVNRIATGALNFAGTLSTTERAQNSLTADYENDYYKVIADFDLNATDLWDTTSVTTSTVTIKTGDTLIVAKNEADQYKFVWIPSGDDVTTLTVYGDKTGTKALENKAGNVGLRFSDIFTVQNNDPTSSASLTAYISLPEAKNGQSGYLTASDWARFNSYASTSTVYEGTTSSNSQGAYLIGNLKIGTADNYIYGKNNVSSLTLNQNDGQDTNPILTFAETGADSVNITMHGSKGIQVKKSGNDIQFTSNLGVDSQSASHLSITDGTGSDLNKKIFKLNVGSVNEEGTVIPGLATTEFVLQSLYSFATSFSVINNSLTSDSHDYHYGSASMVAAVNVDI